MGGIGKTTLAKVLYNKLVTQFRLHSFIANVRESCEQKGLISLQNKLICDLSTGETSSSPVTDDNKGIIEIKGKLSDKRVLIVLDDIDNVTQLNALAGRRDWFYEGSCIIISTRDRTVLQTHLVTDMYEVKELCSSDSMKLFCYHALRKENSTETFVNLSKQIVEITGSLPLALEVFGAFLFNKRSVEEWDVVLHKLKQNRPRHLHDVLKVSFDGLDEEQKCIFLDIACLFLKLHMKCDEVIDVVKGCGFHAENSIDFLVGRSLLKITEDGSLRMHDQIRDMGRQIVWEVNHGDPGMRSRLWDHAEILSIVQAGAVGTGNIQGITLDLDNQIAAVEGGELVLSTRQFEPMTNLRLLQLKDVKLEGNFKHFPAKLKWLQWKNCPLKYLPYDCPRELTVLDLSGSKIERVWGCRWWCRYNNKVAEKLMVLNLSGCNITDVPDLSGHPALEKMILEHCSKLTSIHKSVGDLINLRHLNLRNCSSLTEFPSDVSGLKHLENLILSGCSKLKHLPDDMGSMNSLKELLIDESSIAKLPDSIFRLTKLEMLSLKGCMSLKRLPVCIGNLKALREIFLDDSALEEMPNSIGLLINLKNLSLISCKSLTSIPDSVGNLESLTNFRLNSSSVVKLPDSIGSLSYLKALAVGGCCRITTLPVSIQGLASMVELQLDGTSIVDLPHQIGALKSLKKLEMRNCESLISLPKTIGSLLMLDTLIIVNAAIVKLPEEIGELESLTMLRLNKCKLLLKLPASFGRLTSLHHLIMEESAVTELPETLGYLSSLMVLQMAKKPYSEVPQRVPHNFHVLPRSFSKLSLLTEFNACAWKISGAIPDDFERLSLLEILNLSYNDFSSLPSSLKGLSNLRELDLRHCKELKVLPSLPSNLVQLNAANCRALESICDMSNLESLEDLHLTNCDKLVDIRGLGCLKSLKRFHMGGCNSCSSAVKGKLDKVALRKLYNLSMPGSKIPGWFTADEACYSKHKHLVLRGVIMAVVVSINQEIVDTLRDQLPAIVEAKILRFNKPVFTTVIELLGVPNTYEDQVYLCRYHAWSPLVLMFKDGDIIRVAMRDPPYVKGVQLKKCGIHLIYENDDDYGGNEELLDESQQSESQKLTRFIGSSSCNT